MISPGSHSELVLRVTLEPRILTPSPVQGLQSAPKALHLWFSSTPVTLTAGDSPPCIRLCLCSMHRQGNQGPLREGLSEVTEPEVNKSMCGDSPHMCQAASQAWPALHLETPLPLPRAEPPPPLSRQPPRLPAVSQQRSFGLRASQRDLREAVPWTSVSLVDPQ